MESEAEVRRLRSMLVNGPWRRMAQDRALGMRPQRADMWQAKVYRLRLEALEGGTDEGEPVDLDVMADGGLALDRTERD
jgi:hypothetical protein